VIATGLGVLLIALGVGFTVIGALGLLRLPDFYTRAHAASKPDTMGAVLVMAGLAVLEGIATTTGMKLVLIAIFVLIANPVAIHVLSRSAARRGLRPWARPR
jgi:multicomponent Na+:H+ antiporter subunit G